MKERHLNLTTFKLLLTVVMVLFFGTVDCFFWSATDSEWNAVRGDDRFAPLFTDTSSRYDIFTFQPATGDYDYLTLSAEYPYARYFSYNLYDATATPTGSSIFDAQIVPDEGSTNPFRIGNDRSAAARDYTIFVVRNGFDLTQLPNDANNIMTLPPSAGENGDNQEVAIILRLYRPDQGRDSLGGVPLPDIQVWKVQGDNNNPAEAVFPDYSQNLLYSLLRTIIVGLLQSLFVPPVPPPACSWSCFNPGRV